MVHANNNPNELVIIRLYLSGAHVRHHGCGLRVVGGKGEGVAGSGVRGEEERRALALKVRSGVPGREWWLHYSGWSSKVSREGVFF